MTLNVRIDNNNTNIILTTININKINYTYIIQYHNNIPLYSINNYTILLINMININYD